MFGWFKKRKEQQFEEWLQRKNESDMKAENARKLHEAELREVAIKLERERDLAIKNSDKPWVAITGDSIDEHGRICIELDWNVAFIHYLKKECGFDDGSPEEIVQKWVGALYKEIYFDGKDNALNIFKELPDNPYGKDAPTEIKREN